MLAVSVQPGRRTGIISISCHPLLPLLPAQQSSWETFAMPCQARPVQANTIGLDCQHVERPAGYMDITGISYYPFQHLWSVFRASRATVASCFSLDHFLRRYHEQKVGLHVRPILQVAQTVASSFNAKPVERTSSASVCVHLNPLLLSWLAFCFLFFCRSHGPMVLILNPPIIRIASALKGS